MDHANPRTRPAGTTPASPGGADESGRRTESLSTPARATYPATARGARQRAPVCTGCGAAGRTRDEAADLTLEWLLYEPATGRAVASRFHRSCQPAGVPGELTCSGCGDGPLLDPALATDHGRPADLFTATALIGWLDDHGWTGDPWPSTGTSADHLAGPEDLVDLGVGEGPRCPACSPRSGDRGRQAVAAGAAR